jgi:membrane protein required for colicin V production
MNYIDIVIALMILLPAIGGFKNGFIAEVISLLALVLGIWCSIEFSHITSDFLVENLNVHSKHLKIISFGVTFLVVVVLVHLVGNTLSKIFETVLTGPINRLAGMVFAILRSALFLSIVIMILDRVDQDVSILPKDKKTESRFYEPVKNFAPSVFPFVENWIGKI